MYKHMKVRKTFTEFSVDITVGDVPEETHEQNQDGTIG